MFLFPDFRAAALVLSFYLQEWTMDLKFLLMGILLVFSFGCVEPNGSKGDVTSETAQTAPPHTTYTNPTPQEPPNEITVLVECTDSDFGHEIHTKGISRLTENGVVKVEKEDFCYDDGTLYEYYCEGGTMTHDAVKCPCTNGVCEPIIEFIECIDSDGGDNKDQKGQIHLIKHYSDGSVVDTYPFEDVCIDNGGTLKEYFCDGDEGEYRSYGYICQCSNGAC